MSSKVALVSTYNRDGLADFVKVLVEYGYQIISTGGTAAELRENGLDVIEVSDLTGADEMLDGQVKTLHPHVYSGLLARRAEDSDMALLERLGIRTIDMVVNNLYPFVETIKYPDVSLEDALENIDIGGPAMTRAAAKNYLDVVVVVEPEDYTRVGNLIRTGEVPLDERRRLAAKAFHHIAIYDTAIASYLDNYSAADENTQNEDSILPEEVSFGYNLVKRPRYGENPHQSAGVYATTGESGGIANAELLHGIPMSYLNYFDADAAWSVARSFAGFGPHTAVVVKHGNPCGLAVREDQSDAWIAARDGDHESAFGGIVAFNESVVYETAHAMEGLLLDVIVAPGYSDEALHILKKRKRTRVLRVSPHSTQPIEVRSISGGALVQQPDLLEDEEYQNWKIVTERKPNNDEQIDLWFAWRACRFVRSNAIVFAKDRSLIGMGTGQPNRVTSVFLASRVAGDSATGSVMASDAFFPFADGLHEAANAGITAVAQPGGSVNDDAVIASANEAGISMVFTGKRHFYH